MVATLPVPIEFSLPAGWLSAPPDEVGAGGSAFVALHPPASAGFTANITIAGEIRESYIPLAHVADEAVETLRRTDPDVRLGKRKESGSPENPGLTQSVRLSTVLDGRRLDVVQLQVFLGMWDKRDPRRRAVLHVVLSALPEQFDQVAEDFQKFVSTIRPEEGEHTR
ncbi:hypothetical protein DL991_04790 [Amycolatopsis sp. WAC 01375]|uniref:hypothetical protein n=1 Tax=unclassified Amycolatopsis TaxID=2618356 RepID=UPI000F787B58|nr:MULTISPECIES: hypothetical protein [unclassified Amycolatopsis]RSM82675.1 hypothetical protein DL991_04790 [Amycolatopsis sp. WAC 01375]RSN34567.1 hypothetical protein DL990_13020 [Amycolatopsis sp. WAC 01416]